MIEDQSRHVCLEELGDGLHCRAAQNVVLVVTQQCHRHLEWQNVSIKHQPPPPPPPPPPTHTHRQNVYMYVQIKQPVILGPYILCYSIHVVLHAQCHVYTYMYMFMHVQCTCTCVMELDFYLEHNIWSI